jgi:hypothetical protein
LAKCKARLARWWDGHKLTNFSEFTAPEIGALGQVLLGYSMLAKPHLECGKGVVYHSKKAFDKAGPISETR